MYLPDYYRGYTLCGIGFTDEGKVEGQYFTRKYMGRVSAAPEYMYGMAVTNVTEFELKSYRHVKRYTKRPCESCDKPIDNHDTC